jgi:hypothetical protein
MKRPIKTLKHQSIDHVMRNMIYQYDVYWSTINQVNQIGVIITVHTIFNNKQVIVNNRHEVSSRSDSLLGRQIGNFLAIPYPKIEKNE